MVLLQQTMNVLSFVAIASAMMFISVMMVLHVLGIHARGVTESRKLGLFKDDDDDVSPPTPALPSSPHTPSMPPLKPGQLRLHLTPPDFET